MCKMEIKNDLSVHLLSSKMESFIDRIYKCDTIWLDDDKILTATSKSTCIYFTCAGGHQDEKEIYKKLLCIE